MRPRGISPRSLFVFSYIQLQFYTWGNADFAQYSCANHEIAVINGFFRAWNEPVMNPSRTRFRRAGWVKEGFALAISYSPRKPTRRTPMPTVYDSRMFTICELIGYVP